MYQISKLGLILCFLGSLFSQNVFATTSNGADGAFLINDVFTLNATNNQIFNFTTFDVLSGGVLNFSGLTPTDTITFLATGDINLGGILNFSSNVNFETSGNIFIDGNINVPSTSAFTLITNAASSTIDISSGSVISIGNNPISNPSPNDPILLPPATNNPILSEVVFNPSSFGSKVGLDTANTPISNPSTGGGIVIGGGNGNIVTTGSSFTGGNISIAAVPEPETYIQLLCGLALLTLARRKVFIN